MTRGGTNRPLPSTAPPTPNLSSEDQVDPRVNTDLQVLFQTRRP